MNQPDAARRLAITVEGVVQGVGFRPFIYNLATSLQLRGWVLNDTGIVRIEVEGPAGVIDRFLIAIRKDHPLQARLVRITVNSVKPHAASEGPGTSFTIRDSESGSAPGPAIPADLATCEFCLAEITDSTRRRFRYPFTNCTNCGPRWSIITRLPYDRPDTSMSEFAMCQACRREYEDPTDRRFHAQPIACPQCGPRLQLINACAEELATGDDALRKAGDAVRSGQIVAVKGIGGFQLIVDATSQWAVQRLRLRKQRPDKPLAVMLTDIECAKRYCHISDLEAKALASYHAPILLLRRLAEPPDELLIAPSVAPGNPNLGVMLPYSPLHQLLLEEIGRPIVCTSGNRSEEPMAIGTDDALRQLEGVADVFLTHDRSIIRPVDDSVGQIADGQVQLLRRARGYAPNRVRLRGEVPCILAVGGHLKNTVAISLGADVVMSAHIGDLDNVLGMDVHRHAVRDLLDFFQVTPEAIACDLHPDYRSTRHAEQMAEAFGRPLVRVQHHHAHILSAVAEHHLQGPVLGFAWDGTGYGPDATVWGGEVLWCEGAGFQRVAHLRPFPLPGGDRAAREPRRAALGLLYEMLGMQCVPLVKDWFSESELVLLLKAAARPKLFPRCTSMGRLFDGVAALCGLPIAISFEGQAAMALQFAVDPEEQEAYNVDLSDSEPIVIDWQPLLRRVVSDRRDGCSIGRVAARFHHGLAKVALRLAQRLGCPQIVLSGGCFQNACLTQLVRSRLSEAGFDVYTQQQVPPGDGGIALGQVLGAALQIRDQVGD